MIRSAAGLGSAWRSALPLCAEPSPRRNHGAKGTIAILAALTGLLSCRGDPRASTAAAPPASASTEDPAATSVRVRASRAREDDPRFRRAREGDPLECARLADEEGASGLLEALDDGGQVAETALLAFPYADDADLALGPLAERALAAPPGALPPLLEAMLEIAGRPPRPREPLDPEGVRTAGAALLALARRADLAVPTRALAISGARALAAWGVVDPKQIPTDLDPH